MFRSFSRIANHSKRLPKNNKPIKINKPIKFNIPIEINKEMMYDRINKIKNQSKEVWNQLKEIKEEDRINTCGLIGAVTGAGLGIYMGFDTAYTLNSVFTYSAGYGIIFGGGGAVAGVLIGWTFPIVIVIGAVGILCGIVGEAIYGYKELTKK